MFRLSIVIGLLLPVWAYCQDASPKKDAAKPAAKKSDAKGAPKQGAASVPNTPPDGAERVDKMPIEALEVRDDVFRQVDEKTGKVWIYRRMPFGIFKSAETEDMRRMLADPPDRLQVKELEDGTLEFSKLTPFGVGRYTRKKEDLTGDEKEVWEKYRKSRSIGSSGTLAKERQK